MSSSRRLAVSIATTDLDVRHDAWSRSTVVVGEVQDDRDEQERRNAEVIRPSITISLTLLVSAAVCLSGVGIWATMYALNLRGIDRASFTVQSQTSENFMAATRDFNTPAVLGVQTITEILRTMEILHPGYIRNSSNWMPIAWQVARQFGGSCYCGFPDGSAVGYRNGGERSLITRIESPRGSGILFSYITDALGFKGMLIEQTPFNATDRPWYALASMAGGFYLSPLYAFFGVNTSGYSAAVPIFEDLQPPKYGTGREPQVISTGPVPYPRIIAAVCSVDLTLRNLSAFLSRINIGTSNRGLGFYFSRDGFLLATNDASIASFDGAGNPFLMTLVADRLVNATMAYILASNGIPVDAYSRYGELSAFFNRYVDIANERRIVSLQVFVNADNTTSFFLVLVTPHSDFFAVSDYANMVALLIIFLVVLPVVIVMTAVWTRFCISKPLRQLAMAMYDIPKQFTFKARFTKLSRIHEVEMMQTAFDAMAVTLKSFSKFTPLVSVRNMLRSRTEANLGVEPVTATCFFSDIEGFTSYSENVPPTSLIKALEDYFNNMTQIIELAEGTVGDFIGDAVFAFWNAPIACGPRHAMMCVEAAVSQQERLAVLRSEWSERGLPCFRVRMGINSGKCLAGNVGSRTRLKYTLIGDTVNLASRLEGMGKYYGCYLVISENTFQEPEVAGSFCARILDIVAVVGREKPTVIREVLARRRDATSEQLELESLSVAMMDAYLQADIVTCKHALLKMKALKGNDVSINGMIARLQKLESTGFPEGWTGVVKMKLK